MRDLQHAIITPSLEVPGKSLNLNVIDQEMMTLSINLVHETVTAFNFPLIVFSKERHRPPPRR